MWGCLLNYVFLPGTGHHWREAKGPGTAHRSIYFSGRSPWCKFSCYEPRRLDLLLIGRFGCCVVFKSTTLLSPTKSRLLIFVNSLVLCFFPPWVFESPNFRNQEDHRNLKSPFTHEIEDQSHHVNAQRCSQQSKCRACELSLNLIQFPLSSSSVPAFLSPWRFSFCIDEIEFFK